ncbi:MAG: sortase [Candidatus Yanofskybacteria bacterium]|nr:sortase [Candidatus Yanofskybacteria bacterium]
MHIHNHKRAMRVRFFMVFMGAFVFFFGMLNVRFVYANIQYWIAPGTIRTDDSLGAKAQLLPLAKNLSDRPLPNNAMLVIDSIGVNAPIVFDSPSDTKSLYANLENGVVHYPPSSKPGQLGPAIILGHSSAYPWYKGKYGSVFALLGKLKPGDKFYVQYEDKRLFVYTVKQSIVFNPLKGDDEKLAELEQNSKTSLILVSCWPVGTDYRRIAVEAELVES